MFCFLLTFLKTDLCCFKNKGEAEYTKENNQTHVENKLTIPWQNQKNDQQHCTKHNIENEDLSDRDPPPPGKKIIIKQQQKKQPG